MPEISYSPRFRKLYKKLPNHIQDAAEEKEILFRNDPYQSSLKTHKLTGALKHYWAFSIGYNYRIIFSFISDTEVYFHIVGTHSIYSRFHGE